MNRVLVLAALTFAMALPSRAQQMLPTPENDPHNSDFAVQAGSESLFSDALSGNDAPLQITFGDMRSSWRRMQISSSDEDLLSQIYSSSNPRNFQPQIFYTRGQSLKINGEPFIVAYKLATANDSVPSRDRFGNINNWPQVPQLLTLDTRLELALLNPRLISRFSAIRVLDIAQELRDNAVAVQKARQELTKMVNQTSLSNLQQIGQQLRNYTQSTGKLPSLQNLAAAQKDLQRFGFSSPSPFQHPLAGKSYVSNARLSGRNIKQIGDISRAVVFYEDVASGDGTRGVVFADGNAERIKDSEMFEVSLIPTEPITAVSPKVLPGQKAAKLSGAAALAYVYNIRKIADYSSNSRFPQYYRSESSGRIYYRDPRTHEAIFVAPPTKPILVPESEAIKYQNYAGYNGRTTGQRFGGY